MSCPMDRLKPHSADPTTKRDMPRRKKRLRPIVSESLPQIGMETVDESMYAVVTQA